PGCGSAVTGVVARRLRVRLWRRVTGPGVPGEVVGPCSLGSRRRIPERGVHNRPEVNRPPQQKKPEYDGEHKLQNRHSQSALNELPESRNEEAANRGDDVSCGSLTGH